MLLLDPDFGLYVWPSSLILSEYIFHHLDLFQGSTSTITTAVSTTPKVILELGAGTALPTLLLAKATDPASTVIVATDRPNVPSILENIRQALHENQIPIVQGGVYKNEIDAPRVMVRGLGWGDFTFADPSTHSEGGLLQLLKDIKSSVQQEREGRHYSGRIDLILGSDTFYNPPDFEPLLATVAYIIHRHNPDCVFLTSYQNRSAKRNINHLLQKWDLEGREIDWQEEQAFDLSKYVTGDDQQDRSSSDLDLDQDQDHEMSESSMLSDDEKGVARDDDIKDDDYWLQLAKREIDKQTATTSIPPTLSPQQQPNKQKPIPITSLVDYGSSSESESEMDVQPEDLQDEDNQYDSHPSSSHKLGDGGTLNSVHLLWICKRGRAESLFEPWKMQRTK
ncbi:Methyltransferase-like protein 23 [Gryganskiella cystojenkinii]|nr:Methyltransferase-like protein 23 [Gryganskiella cystojenkinii]